jgi:hypothetical protein
MGSVVIFRNDKKIEGLVQLQGSSHHFCGAVPTSRDVPHHFAGFDFTLLAGLLEVSIDCGAVGNTFR